MAVDASSLFAKVPQNLELQSESFPQSNQGKIFPCSLPLQVSTISSYT